MARQPNGAGPGETLYTPSLVATTTSPTLGTGGSATGGWRYLDGGLVFWWALFVFGSSPSAGSGYYQVTLPVPPLTDNRKIGTGVIIDASASSEIRPVLAMCSAGLSAGFQVDPERAWLVDTSAPAAMLSALLSDSAPFTWAEGDQINLSGIYQVA